MLLIYPFWKHLPPSQIDLFGSVSLQAVQILVPEVVIKNVPPEVLGEFFFIKSVTDKGSG